jgi:hypothetical protein
MRAQEIIRGILDMIDGVEPRQPIEPVEDMGYSDTDIKRFKQIVDLVDADQEAIYSNEPNEQYADIESVTIDAGADGMNGTKDPADIRGEHPSLYPGRVHGAR